MYFECNCIYRQIHFNPSMGDCWYGRVALLFRFHVSTVQGGLMECTCTMLETQWDYCPGERRPWWRSTARDKDAVHAQARAARMGCADLQHPLQPASPAFGWYWYHSSLYGHAKAGFFSRGELWHAERARFWKCLFLRQLMGSGLAVWSSKSECLMLNTNKYMIIHTNTGCYIQILANPLTPEIWGKSGLISIE